MIRFENIIFNTFENAKYTECKDGTNMFIENNFNKDSREEAFVFFCTLLGTLALGGGTDEISNELSR